MHMKELFVPIVGPEGVREHEPMSAHTTFAVGGPADCMVFPADANQLAAVLETARRAGLPTLVLGRGSNLLCADAGVRGLVVSTENMQTLSLEGTTVTAGAGVTLAHAAEFAAAHGLTGLEFACGIPGSLGGAVYMNAGAYGGEMKDVVADATLLDPDGRLMTLAGSDMGFAYRHSLLREEPLICVAARLALAPDDQAAIRARMADLTQRRESRQPLEMASAGSTFKRPQGHYTGPLIIDCGLSGCRIGGAQVSTKHAGFVVNTGTATADDVASLIYHIEQTVWQKTGVRLETEVRFVGDWASHPLFDKIWRAE
jgi:UDP-N-acetylmuramate dehydrogenase